MNFATVNIKGLNGFESFRVDFEQAQKNGAKLYKELHDNLEHPCKSCAMIEIVNFLMNVEHETPTEKANKLAVLLFIYKDLYKKDYSQNNTIDIAEMCEKLDVGVTSQEEPSLIITVPVFYGLKFFSAAIHLCEDNIKRTYTEEINALNHPCDGCLVDSLIERFECIDDLTNEQTEHFINCSIYLACCYLGGGDLDKYFNGNIMQKDDFVEPHYTSIKDLTIIELNEIKEAIINSEEPI
jgi:hypothetical protein